MKNRRVKVRSVPEECKAFSLVAREARYTLGIEVQILCWLASRHQGNILEIGCNEGVTTCDLAKNFPERRVYAVDYLGKDIALVPEQSHEQPLEETVCRYAKALPNVRPIFSKSKDLQASQFEDVGCIFIDGDHSFDGVNSDSAFALSYLQRRGRGGVVIWHDYYKEAPWWVGVGRYIDTLSHVYDTVTHIRGTRIVFLEIRSAL